MRFKCARCREMHSKTCPEAEKNMFSNTDKDSDSGTGDVE